VTRSQLLATNHADVWVLEMAVDRVPADADCDVLSRDERATADRFFRPHDRTRYIRSHVELRRVLSAYVGCAPHDVQFERTPQGKPYLIGSNLHFNLSHSGRYAVVGVCAASAIGVDVEEIRVIPECHDLARKYFAPHEAAWIREGADEEQLERFYRLWTIKEAFVKATGDGMSALARAAVTDDWCVEPFTGVAGYAAAAVVARGIRVQWRTEGTHPWRSFPTSWSASSSGSTSLRHSCSTTSPPRRFEPMPPPSSSVSTQR
jgi:4'-phosphopantetheinyl transferase